MGTLSAWGVTVFRILALQLYENTELKMINVRYIPLRRYFVTSPILTETGANFKQFQFQLHIN